MGEGGWEIGNKTGLKLEMASHAVARRLMLWEKEEWEEPCDVRVRENSNMYWTVTNNNTIPTTYGTGSFVISCIEVLDKFNNAPGTVHRNFVC